MNPNTNLKQRAVRRLSLTLGILALLLFVSAGSWRFWQAWLFLLLMSGFWIYFYLDFMKRDPELINRRLQTEEPQPEQKVFHQVHSTLLILAFIVAGLDFRFGWSRSMGSIPTALVSIAQAVVVAGYFVVFWTMKANSFAASVIRVEASQKVVDAGPYARVRHPMYVGMIMAELAAPFALGSFAAVPLFAMLIPLMIFRLIHEEKTLRRELVGYSEYCAKTRFRLIPGVW